MIEACVTEKMSGRLYSLYGVYAVPVAANGWMIPGCGAAVIHLIVMKKIFQSDFNCTFYQHGHLVVEHLRKATIDLVAHGVATGFIL